ncbi:MAG: DUF3185 family protein [Nibricoccus sp.]
MYKMIAIVILVVGAILLVYGLNSANSLSSSVTKAVSGTPTDKSLGLIIGGIAGILVGGLVLFSRRSP